MVVVVDAAGAVGPVDEAVEAVEAEAHPRAEGAFETAENKKEHFWPFHREELRNHLLP